MIENDLGEFLRAHRDRLRPGDVGLPSRGRRRVTGLRREEVAVLAGMNSDYYARLEQGREHSPSAQVLDAIAAALSMDDQAREHMYRLAGSAPRTPRAPREAVSRALRNLLDAHASAPAFVLNPAKDLLALNPLAEALFEPFTAPRNLARMTFLDPAAPRFFRHWDRFADSIVAGLRHATGTDPGYARLHELVNELGRQSQTFAERWSRHNVYGKTQDATEFDHPEVGSLSLDSLSFDVRSAPGQILVVYQPEPNSVTAQALTLLGTLQATRRQRSPGER